MKNLFFFIFCLLWSSISFSQTFISTFEDGTLQGWTNTDGSITNLTIEETGQWDQLMLQKNCDGSNSPVGEMAIINTTEWAGNYFYDVIDMMALHTIDDIYMKNDNNFDLYLRFGFTGANGYIVVTTDPIIIPALSDWNFYGQSYGFEFQTIYNLTILNDTSGLPYEEVFDNVYELFEDVVEFRIIHNEVISLDGQIVTGTLQIDDIKSFWLLSNSDQLKAEIKLFPNPVKNKVTLTLPFETEGEFELYNVIGKKVLSNEFSSLTTQIDLSELTSGIYVARIKIDNQTIIKKIVKL